VVEQRRHLMQLGDDLSLDFHRLAGGERALALSWAADQEATS
jgi:hypothetical protein